MNRDKYIILGVGILAMGLVILLSNHLVEIPFAYQIMGVDLENWLTWGAFSYPLCFLVTDISNRLGGANIARMVVVPGFVLGVVMSLIYADSRIALASGTAFLIAQMLDIYVFNRLRHQSWWRAPLASSLLAALFDTFLFFSIAFYATGLPWVGWAIGDLMVKALMAFCLLPLFRLMLLFFAKPSLKSHA